MTTKNIILIGEIKELIKDNINFRAFINNSIGRHFKLDFGDMDNESKTLNLKNARLGRKVLSIYKYENFKVCINTEPDRSLTTVMIQR